MRYDHLIYEMPYCAACGRTQAEPYRRWHQGRMGRITSLNLAPLHPKLRRQKTRKSVIPLCRLHLKNGELQFEHLLWLKKVRDGAYYDPGYLSRHVGRLPREREPEWLRSEFSRRRQENQPQPGEPLFELENYGADYRALTAIELYLNVKTIGDLKRVRKEDLSDIPTFGRQSLSSVISALRKYVTVNAELVPASGH